MGRLYICLHLICRGPAIGSTARCALKPKRVDHVTYFVLSSTVMASSSSSPPRTPCSAFLPSSSAMPFYRRPFLDSYYAAPSYFAEKSDFTLIGEEEDSQDASYYFAPESPRSTFFVVSAERGRWKTDPMPRKFHSKPRICEPRPSSWEKELETPVSDSADTLPALDTDRDSSFGPTPSSPLPPSSPPLSPISRASSPLPLSSPLSSPVSEMLPLDEEPIQDAMVSTLIKVTLLVV